jgi:hypothetical protein
VTRGQWDVSLVEVVVLFSVTTGGVVTVSCSVESVVVLELSAPLPLVKV